MKRMFDEVIKMSLEDYVKWMNVEDLECIRGIALTQTKLRSGLIERFFKTLLEKVEILLRKKED